ncbi:hypothetical protein KR222_003538 [Zaprionus bogoriensis]|nr:hypothetical protein KR222_003538 [Zaprionus bogoriensis]
MNIESPEILPQLLLLLCLLLSASSAYKLNQARSSPQLRKRAADGLSLASISEQKPDCSENVSPMNDAKSKASNIAIKAAQEARAASDAQLPAAENAAQQVKTQLAEKALAAAKAADAALAGKQQIVDQLEAEVHEGELVVREESASLQSSQGNCAAAAQAAKQSNVQIKVLTDAVKNAQENVQNSELASNGAQQELSEKQQLLDAAKKRVEMLLRQLDCARADFKYTKKVAERAATAAQEAKARATRERRMAEIRCKLQQRNLKL